MKTAEDLAYELLGGENLKQGSVEWLQQIQLDAIKEGMRRGADKLVNTIIPEQSLALIKERRQVILSAAEQLTIKDL